MNVICIIWFIITLLNLQRHSTFGQNVIARTKYGLVVGSTLLDYNNQTYYAFQSLPYAKPPLGELRFRPPAEVDKWTGYLNATQSPPSCVQLLDGAYFGQEDCLYLNVYTKAVNSTKLQSVLVYLHGGGFIRLSGSRRLFNPKFLMIENIVVVTLNYRLTSLGFLTLDVPGSQITPNNGFRDQVMVLKWVQKNIRYFGGNPNSVTLSGESAGAMAAHYHLFSPLSAGLVHKVIARSSTSLMPVKPLEPTNAIILAQQLGINTTNITEMVNELQSIPPRIIHQAELDLHWYDFFLDRAMWSGLYIEKPGPKSFISKPLLTMLEQGDFQKVPILLSITDQEGLIFKTEVIPNVDQMENISLHIPAYFGNNSDLVAQKIVAYYFNESNFELPYVEFWGDMWYKYSTYRTLRIACQYQRIYMSHFALDTRLNIFKRTHREISQYGGASHTDDDSYIFFKEADTPILDRDGLEDIWMRRMVRLQANFIKYSNPTPHQDKLLQSIRWPAYTNNQSDVLFLSNYNLSVVPGNNSNYKFLDNIYNDYAVGFY